MVLVNKIFNTVIIILIILGIIAAIINSVFLFLFAVACLFLLMLFTQEYRYMECLGIFAFSPMICCPYNIGLSIRIGLALFGEIHNIILIFIMTISLVIVLTCLEEVMFAILSGIIWREQDDIRKL